MSEADREACRQGFDNGAQMVDAAVAAHRRPYALQVGTASGALLSKQALPEGVTVVEDAPPEVELDAATGLEIIRCAPTKIRGFTQGRGASEDKAEAKRWFEKAAALGHQGAKEALEGLFPKP